MKKILMIVFTLFIGFFATTKLITAMTETDELVLHYYRYDGNYDGFNIWMWEYKPNAGGGKQFEFSNDLVHDKYGAYIKIDLKKEFPNATTLGVIIKKGAWGRYQEPGGDRFITLNMMEKTGNTVNAYTVEQETNIGISNEDLNNNIPNYQPKILNAYFTNNTTIKANSTHEFNLYNLYENGELIRSSSSDSKELTIELDNMSLQNSYNLELVFEDNYTNSKSIDISRLYESKEFTDAFTYDGELGAIYSKNKTIFRLWAPISTDVTLNLYKQGHPNYDNNGKKNDELTPYEAIEMVNVGQGVWEAIVESNLASNYYTFSVTNNSVTNEVTDPYSYSTGANGLRSMVVDFESTNPEDWKLNDRPDNVKNLTDYIVYELHVRDLTSHESWNGTEENRGKFLGFTESGTTYTKNGVTVSTGLDHLTELGINAVQLLPIFDFGYIDEVALANDPKYTNTFNWGYMPYHFNTLEGAYATNPFDGNVRINEFKQLVNSLHNNDMRVIMDVVYNHTGESATSNFHKIIPGYYHRMNQDGGFSNGSGTGNETASERPMVRKFFVDSLKFLATEYNLSGFRFDLMALHDVDTMLEIEEELHKIDPTIVIYGEPWDAGGAALDPKLAAGKDNIKNMNTVGAFNDASRDAIKGSVFNENEGAWLQGVNPASHVENIKYGIVGGIDHSQVNKDDKWHLSPERMVNYVSAHDNNTLYDKIRLTGVNNRKSIESMVIQANALVLTSQGIPFLHAGVDFARSKPLDEGYDENSYESPDAVNQLRWDRKADYINIFEYYQALISIRKSFPQFRMNNADDINKYLKFIPTGDENAIAFEINQPNMPQILVLNVGHKLEGHIFDLPEAKEYRVLTGYTEASLQGLETASYKVQVLGNTTSILVENTSLDDVKVNKKIVKIKPGEQFNPIDNITFDNSKHQIYTTSFYDVNVSSKYTINVNVIDSKGNLIKLSYLLHVTGSKDVTVK